MTICDKRKLLQESKHLMQNENTVFYGKGEDFLKIQCVAFLILFEK